MASHAWEAVMALPETIEEAIEQNALGPAGVTVANLLCAKGLRVWSILQKPGILIVADLDSTSRPRFRLHPPFSRRHRKF